MPDIRFLIEQAAEGGWLARAVGADIFTEADDLPTLHHNIHEAVRCHFEPDSLPIHIAIERSLP